MDTFALVSAERLRLADALSDLAPEDWEQPSLCDGWSVHVVAAHLNAPWTVSLPSMAVSIVRARSFDGGLDRVARGLADRMDPAACIAGLRANADSHFTPPGSGPEAPLTDVLVHGADILRPLGRSVASAPEARATAVQWLTSGRAKGFVPRGRTEGLRFEADDVAVGSGSGPLVRGTALAVSGALCGRRVWLDDLAGDGVAELTARLRG